MFVTPINNFNTNVFKGSLKEAEPQKDAPKSTEAEKKPETVKTTNTNDTKTTKPAGEKPKMRQPLMQDTVSFGEGNKDKSGKSLRRAAGALGIATMLSGAPSCTPDLEISNSLSQSTTLNLADYKKCCCDSVPFVRPGGRDTIYIPVPGPHTRDTIYVEGPTKTDTIYLKGDTVFVPGPHTTDTIIVEKPVPGEVVHDTIVMPGTKDTIFIDRPVHDTIYVDKPVKPDTIYLKPDTVYIPKDFDYENDALDSIFQWGHDLDVPEEGNGKIPVRIVGENEYRQEVHDLRFNGFFSSKSKVSYIDHGLEKEYSQDPNDPKNKFYRRYDLSTSPANGKCYLTVYEPTRGLRHLPSREEGEAGWTQKRTYYVQNQSGKSIKQVMLEAISGDDARNAKYSPNTVRGKGNVYKESPIPGSNQTQKTTIVGAKIYRGKFED